NNLPKMLLEVLGISGIVIIVLVISIINKTSDSVLPVVGIFAISGIRMLPSVNNIIVSFQNFQYSFSIIDFLFEDVESNISKDKSEENSYYSFKSKLELKEINFSYTGSSDNTLKSISFELEKGKVIGLIGKSGAGKTTLIDLLLGLHKPTSGKLLLDGKEINDLKKIRKDIGYIPQNIFLLDDTILNNITLCENKKEISWDNLNKSIEVSQLNNYIDTTVDGINTVIGERGVKLSGGQKQRIGIARAIYRNPKILLMDEATSALDNETEFLFMDAIAKLRRDISIVIIAHRLTTVKNCDLIYEIEDGKIINIGHPSQILDEKKYNNSN
ncbi:MAG: ATP-binding cassette domain-containing protein, partial [Nanoarchaeota archaeon]|nr:ATP-binding cassette domain-containing protein [Nanoarchaeota archaeon]